MPSKTLSCHEVSNSRIVSLPWLNLAARQDIYSLFHLDRPFKFISKTSNFFIPIIGWSMFLTGMNLAQRTILVAMLAANYEQDPVQSLSLLQLKSAGSWSQHA